MTNWWICDAGGMVLEIFEGETRLDAVRNFLFVYGMPVDKDGTNGYQALRTEEIFQNLPF